MSAHEHATAWARYTEMVPEQLRAAGWTPWIFYSGVTLSGDLAYRIVRTEPVLHHGVSVMTSERTSLCRPRQKDGIDPQLLVDSQREGGSVAEPTPVPRLPDRRSEAAVAVAVSGEQGRDLGVCRLASRPGLW